MVKGVWATPRVTSNSQLLLGMLMAVIHKKIDGYRLEAVDAASGEIIIVNEETGNRYAMSVHQISGDEVAPPSEGVVQS
jgi:hypothetical protein